MYPSVYLCLSINLWVIFFDLMVIEGIIAICNFLTVQLLSIKPVRIVSEQDDPQWRALLAFTWSEPSCEHSFDLH